MELALPFTEDSFVVKSAVLVLHMAQDLLRSTNPFAQMMIDLVCQRKKKGYEGFPIVRLELENIQTDALRLHRLIQEPIACSLFQSGRNRLTGNALQLKHGCRRLEFSP
jgi:hypothetical protein